MQRMEHVLNTLIALLARVLDVVLSGARWIGVGALGIMVLVTLLQVVFRYGFNNALPWPDEAARFCMLWMTGLMAPIAWRQGGFVAIDTLSSALPPRLGAILGLGIFILAFGVIAYALILSGAHVKSGWLFASSSLKLDLTFWGGQIIKIKLAWMYLSLRVGFALLALVTIELLLRQLRVLIAPTRAPAAFQNRDQIGAE